MIVRRFASGDQRGLTLIEVMIVVVLAGVVTLGLVGFYLQSQSMWMDASTQALAQRDATGLIEVMRSKTAAAAKALAQSVPPDNRNSLLILYDADNTETDRFFWNAADSLVHRGEGPNGTDQGAVLSATVERFHVSVDALLPLVTLDTLRVRSTSGSRVKMTAAFALYNGTPL
jgi:prepilin-type N-terminal cleavage/methylation domain-containing protein